jgi:alpha-glucosidase/alpha-D-xyloside xylohydrolase
MGFVEAQRDLPRQSEMNNPAIEPVCRKYAELRYRLIPYTYTLAAESRESGLPLMRAMWLHYPQDQRLRGLGTQYLWGRDLLVVPVFQPAAATRDVVLPAGDWYDWWTGEKQTGPTTVTRPVDLATMPIYVRAGAIIPLDPVRQSMDQPVTEPTTIRVYTGASGQFRWYEDDGRSQEYLAGMFAWTTLTWDDDARRLTIQRAPAAGSLELPGRKLVIELVPEGASQAIDFDGRQAAVSFAGP